MGRACGMYDGRKKSIMQRLILPIRQVTAAHQTGDSLDIYPYCVLLSVLLILSPSFFFASVSNFE